MFWGQSEKGDSKDCVWSGCETGYLLITILDWKSNLGASGPAYPIPLHRLHVFWEYYLIQGFEQLVGVLGHAQEPLRHVSLNHLQSTSPTSVVLDLLIREDCVAIDAPIHRSRPPLDQSFVMKVEEHRLVPFVVSNIRCGELSPPVVGVPHPPLVRLNAGNIAGGHVFWVSLFLLCSVLSRHSK